AFFIITMFSFNLFFAGHYTPGGGFVGGLLMSAAVLLLLIAYDIKTLEKMLPIPLKFLISLGLLFALGVPLFLMIFGKQLFTHARSEEHTSELQSRFDLVCRLLLEKKNNQETKSR